MLQFRPTIFCSLRKKFLLFSRPYFSQFQTMRWGGGVKPIFECCFRADAAWLGWSVLFCPDFMWVWACIGQKCVEDPPTKNTKTLDLHKSVFSCKILHLFQRFFSRFHVNSCLHWSKLCSHPQKAHKNPWFTQICLQLQDFATVSVFFLLSCEFVLILVKSGLRVPETRISVFSAHAAPEHVQIQWHEMFGAT